MLKANTVKIDSNTIKIDANLVIINTNLVTIALTAQAAADAYFFSDSCGTELEAMEDFWYESVPLSQTATELAHRDNDPQ